MIQQLEKEMDELYARTHVLGVQVQSQYLYIVQPHKISVYEYHGKGHPQLCEQLIHNQVILDYCINEHYICTHSPSLIQVRDRKHWGNVIYTHALPKKDKNDIFLLLEGHFLLISQLENDNLIFQKTNVQTKQVLETINLGKVQSTTFEYIKNNKPIFLKQLGMINDIYIWNKNHAKVQIGILYSANSKTKGKFQINCIEPKNSFIHQVYHHKIHCSKYPHQSPEYVVIISQKTDKKYIYLQLYQILPRDSPHSKSTHQAPGFQAFLHQFTFLGKFNEINPSNSLVSQVLNEAIVDQSKASGKQSKIQIELGLSDYSSSFYHQGKLWISSSNYLCQIEFIQQNSIENIIQHQKDKSQIIKSIDYTQKIKQKWFIGLYKQRILFSQNTTSFDLCYPRQTQEIAQQIQIYQVNDQILDKQVKKIDPEIEKMKSDILMITIEQKQKEYERVMDMDEAINYRSQKILASFQSQTDFIQLKQSTSHIAIQTEIPQKHYLADFDQIQELVAKYSSSLSVSCTKLKQSHFQKDKIDREIHNIISDIVKNQIQPLLEHRFIAILDIKMREISEKILYTLQAQLENLNENMRKIEVKQNNLRGKRIFQFGGQVEYLKQTVAGIMSSIKAGQVQKYALNQVILDEARSMKDKIFDIEKSIIQISTKNHDAQKDINHQIAQICQLIKKIDLQKGGDEDSKSELDDSDESEQRSETSGEDSSQKSSDFQEDEAQTPNPYYQPQHHHNQRNYQLQKKGKKALQFIDNTGYTPYPHPQMYHPMPQMSPYYYPFIPQTSHVPMQAYYPPQYPYPKVRQDKAIQPSKIKPKKSKESRAKKSKE